MTTLFSARRDNIIAAVLLVLGSLALLVVMSQHPRSHAGAQGPVELVSLAQRTRVMHVVVICLMWLILIGKSRVAFLLGVSRLAVFAGLMLLLLGGGLMTGAALIDGLAVPGLLDYAAGSQAAADAANPLLLLCRQLNHACAAAGLVAFAASIVAWCIPLMMMSRGWKAVGVVALLVSSVLLVLVLSGTLPMNVHGMLVFTAVELLWSGTLAIMLWRGASDNIAVNMPQVR